MLRGSGAILGELPFMQLLHAGFPCAATSVQSKMRTDEQCKVTCKKVLTADEVKAFTEKLDDEYRVFM